MRLLRSLFVALLVGLSVAADAQTPALQSVPPVTAVTATEGMVVAQEAEAARVGIEILRKGGNAVDAAVAVGFALAVTYPRAGNIGGGGFMVIHLAGRNEQIAIDYRETAPAAITRDSFLDADGNADPAKSRDSAFAIGVPGTVAGLALAHARYGSGRFTLAELLAPAIALARNGIRIADATADSLPQAHERLARWPSTARIFLKPDGRPLAEGDTLVQSDLAATLEAIARHGPRAFYQGEVAAKIAVGVQLAGGVMTTTDLAAYAPIVRKPARGTYRGYDIISMPPSSSGGVILIEMLNILEGFDLGAADEVERLHLMIETMKRAYADRARFLGDPAQVAMPLETMMSKAYAAKLRGNIDRDRGRAAADIRPAVPGASPEGDNTTHFSIIDNAGNAVANTTTLNFSYGVGLVADGTGILLNNELDDFAAKPGAPNAYGLVGGEANAPGPGKRPLSSMTPTIVLKDGRAVLVTGSPGGSRIISTVLNVVVNVIDRGMDVAAAVGAPRVHHQWLPDAVALEPGFAAEMMEALEARGHTIALGPPRTSANSIAVTPAGLVGAADTRTRGALAAGY